MKKFRGIVVENCSCLVQGIMDWAGKNDCFNSITATSDWNEVKNLPEENDPLVLITTGKWINNSLDTHLFQEFLSKYQVKVLCLIDKSITHNIVELYNCGIQCMIAMDDPMEEFQWGIKELVSGKRHISSELLSTFLELRISIKSKRTYNVTLTKREEEILTLISQGFTNKEIALKLFLSKRTVDGYREAILDKFGARNTAQLITITSDTTESW
jgi:DNA-binding NarL/FixJ family response regulator